MPPPSSPAPRGVTRAITRWTHAADVRVYLAGPLDRGAVVAPILWRSGDGWRGDLVGMRRAGGRWTVARAEPLPVDPAGSIGPGTTILVPLRWWGTTTLGGLVDPSATALRVLDAEGKEQTRAKVVDGAVVVAIDPGTASQLVLERGDELLAALSVPLLRPPRPAPPTPGSGTVSGDGTGAVRALLERIAGDPGAPPELAHPAAPPGLVDGLRRLLVRTPRVSAILDLTRFRGHLETGARPREGVHVGWEDETAVSAGVPG